MLSHIARPSLKGGYFNNVYSTYYMKKIIYLFLFFAAFQLSAQQENHYTQFMYNKLLINPGFAGAREVASLSAIYRNQWLGFTGAPKALLLSFDTPFSNKRAGFGMNLANTKKGITNQYYGTMAYSYSIIRTDNLAIKLGLQAGVRYYDINFSDPNAFYYDNPFQDQSIQFGNNIRQLKGTVGVGAYFDYKEFYFGVSVPNLYENNLGINPNALTLSAQEYRHYYAMMGVLIPLSDKIFLKPSVIAKYVQNSPFDFDASLSLWFNNKFSIGASYRHEDSVDLTTFFQLSRNLAFGAAYDFTTSELAKYNNGSIEVLLRYDFGKGSGQGIGKEQDNLSNPRFFF